MSRIRIAILLLTLLTAACEPEAPPPSVDYTSAATETVDEDDAKTTPIPKKHVLTYKPTLLGRHWMAITGKPLGASAGARIFYQGGNAVDATCAMLAVTSTMWDVLGWGGETQALIWHPHEKKVIGINALGVAPTGATPEFFIEQEMDYPPAFGPLAAVTPGTPGGLMVMLAEYGTLSLAEVLQPAIEMADGYPIEEDAVRSIRRHRKRIAEWPYSKAVFLPHENEEQDLAAGRRDLPPTRPEGNARKARRGGTRSPGGWPGS